MPLDNFLVSNLSVSVDEVGSPLRSFNYGDLMTCWDFIDTLWRLFCWKLKVDRKFDDLLSHSLRCLSPFRGRFLKPRKISILQSTNSVLVQHFENLFDIFFSTPEDLRGSKERTIWTIKVAVSAEFNKISNFRPLNMLESKPQELKS